MTVKNVDEVWSILRAMPFSMALLDDKLCYLAMSQSWKESYPTRMEDPIGKPIYEAHDNYQDLWVTRLKQVLGGEELSHPEEMIEIRPGIQAWLNWKLVPWRAGETIAGVIVCVEDVTRRRLTEDRILQNAKLTALGEMAGGIAHEINNPLAVLRGFIDLMRRQAGRGFPDPAQFRQYLERSLATVDRISRIISSMQRMSRNSSGDPVRSYSVNILVEDALDFIREKFTASGVPLDVSPLAYDVSIPCRPTELSQVLLNLLMNALQAQEKLSTGWVRVNCVIEERKVRVSVQDAGPGIPEHLREKIFHPFYTTKETGKGTGLGLSISRRILEDHGGKLYLDETSAHTRFVLELALPEQGA